MDVRTTLKTLWDAENYEALLAVMHGQGVFSQRQWPVVCWSTTGVNTLACPLEPIAPASESWATLSVPCDPFERQYDVEITLNTHAPRPDCVNWVNNSQQHVFKRVVSRDVANKIVEFAKSLG